MIKCAISTSKWWNKLHYKNIIGVRGETLMLKDIILKKRKQKNMTQEQLAEQLGVARQTVSNWELG